MLCSQYSYCPFSMYRYCNKECIFSFPQHTHPLEDQFRTTIDDYYYDLSYIPKEILRENESDAMEEDYYLDGVRAPQGEINRIVGLLAARQSNVFDDLNNYGINRRTSTFLFRLVVGYVLDNERNFTGNQNQRVNALLADFERRYRSVLTTYIAKGVPPNRLGNILRTVIGFTLNSPRPTPHLTERQRPTERPTPSDNWSRWEDLDGNLTSEPESVSWSSNRIDVFARGRNNQLIHSWRNFR